MAKVSKPPNIAYYVAQYVLSKLPPELRESGKFLYEHLPSELKFAVDLAGISPGEFDKKIMGLVGEPIHEYSMADIPQPQIVAIAEPLIFAEKRIAEITEARVAAKLKPLTGVETENIYKVVESLKSNSTKAFRTVMDKYFPGGTKAFDEAQKAAGGASKTMGYQTTLETDIPLAKAMGNAKAAYNYFINEAKFTDSQAKQVIEGAFGKDALKEVGETVGAGAGARVETGAIDYDKLGQTIADAIQKGRGAQAGAGVKTGAEKNIIESIKNAWGKATMPQGIMSKLTGGKKLGAAAIGTLGTYVMVEGNNAFIGFMAEEGLQNLGFGDFFIKNDALGFKNAIEEHIKIGSNLAGAIDKVAKFPKAPGDPLFTRYGGILQGYVSTDEKKIADAIRSWEVMTGVAWEDRNKFSDKEIQDRADANTSGYDLDNTIKLKNSELTSMIYDLDSIDKVINSAQTTIDILSRDLDKMKVSYATFGEKSYTGGAADIKRLESQIEVAKNKKEEYEKKKQETLSSLTLKKKEYIEWGNTIPGLSKQNVEGMNTVIRMVSDVEKSGGIITSDTAIEFEEKELIPIKKFSYKEDELARENYNKALSGETNVKELTEKVTGKSTIETLVDKIREKIFKTDTEVKTNRVGTEATGSVRKYGTSQDTTPIKAPKDLAEAILAGGAKVKPVDIASSVDFRQAAKPVPESTKISELKEVPKSKKEQAAPSSFEDVLRRAFEAAGKSTQEAMQKRTAQSSSEAQAATNLANYVARLRGAVRGGIGQSAQWDPTSQQQPYKSLEEKNGKVGYYNESGKFVEVARGSGPGPVGFGTDSGFKGNQPGAPYAEFFKVPKNEKEWKKLEEEGWRHIEGIGWVK